jgi:hypothetical protein
MENASFGETRLRVPNEFRLTSGGFCHPPEAKFRPIRPTATPQLQIIKQLAASGWGEIGRISPHDKKKKFQ